MRGKSGSAGRGKSRSASPDLDPSPDPPGLEIKYDRHGQPYIHTREEIRKQAAAEVTSRRHVDPFREGRPSQKAVDDAFQHLADGHDPEVDPNDEEEKMSKINIASYKLVENFIYAIRKAGMIHGINTEKLMLATANRLRAVATGEAYLDQAEEGKGGRGGAGL